MGGDPKALIELGGRRIIERVLAAIRPVVDDVLIVTNTPELYGFLGLPMVPDVYPEHGSLGGIYSGLKAAHGDAAFTVACDMPFLHTEIARLVVERAAEADVVVPRVGDQLRSTARPACRTSKSGCSRAASRSSASSTASGCWKFPKPPSPRIERPRSPS
ncbi:MAG: hypothetical protein DMD82_10990 [Candidatus Rokuibacteriota bacterium]|nr:MAG: hypothetical protein DMD82_10990 [Candidatus Rokubacteria bacterium]